MRDSNDRPRISGLMGVLRRARVTDVPAAHELINAQAALGVMLPRPRGELYDFLRDFVVYEEAGELVATGALHVVWENLGEIRSVAVKEPHRGRRIAAEIVEHLLSEAILLGLGRVFVLTFIPEFFRRFGFELVERQELPHKVWADCVRCPHFPDCAEVPMVRSL